MHLCGIFQHNKSLVHLFCYWAPEISDVFNEVHKILICLFDLNISNQILIIKIKMLHVGFSNIRAF